MNTYLWVKLVHILSATLLFGTGIGTAFSSVLILFYLMVLKMGA